MPENASYLDDLDPDDPRTESQQIANQLRAAILTRKIQPGEKLPSQPELAARYGVARETVKAALRQLAADKLIVSRQGSGTFVRAKTERAVGLRPHIERAFERTTVQIDFAGFSGETLTGVLQEPLDKIRAGRLTPDEISLRVLLPDLTAPMGLPALASTAADDERVRARAQQITRRFNDMLIDAVTELADLELVKSGSVEIRTYHTSPLFKLFIINGDEVFFGFYPVMQHEVRLDGEVAAIYDPMGKDANLFHFAQSEDESSVSGQYVVEARKWFDSVWQTVGRPLAR